jgi:long-chain acyl-CoA synthetase
LKAEGKRRRWMSRAWSRATPLDFVISGAKKGPESPAVRMGGVEMNYRELLEELERWAGFFRAHGVGPKTKVAVYTDNNLYLTLSMFALWGLGAVCLPMNVAQRPEKLLEIERSIAPDIGFYSQDFSDRSSRPFQMRDLEGEKRDRRPLATPSPDATAMIMFTSGTSGVPKGVGWTHGAIAHNNLATAERLAVTPEDRIFINTPPYTTSSITHVITMLAAGASIVAERGFLFGTGILDQMRDFDCTGFGGVPVHFMRILATIAETPLPPRLRFLMNSGEHLPTPVIRGIRAAAPDLQIYCVYGITEGTGRFCILDPKKIDEKTGSVGFPIEGMTVSVRDEEGGEVGPGGEGEVYADGVCLMKGYINSPEANMRSMTPCGFATGDFGYLDEEGYLFLAGRRDDIIKVGGEKVSLNLIEEAVYGFDDFSEFVAAPYESEHLGSSPCLFYVLKAGKKFDRPGLLKHLKKTLPDTHIPTRFIEVTSIPRTGSGKAVRKSDLLLQNRKPPS